MVPLRTGHVRVVNHLDGREHIHNVSISDMAAEVVARYEGQLASAHGRKKLLAERSQELAATQANLAACEDGLAICQSKLKGERRAFGALRDIVRERYLIKSMIPTFDLI